MVWSGLENTELREKLDILEKTVTTEEKEIWFYPGSPGYLRSLLAGERPKVGFQSC